MPSRDPDPPADTLPVVSAGEAVVDPHGACPVCGCELGDQTTQCPSCATHHHKDCWTYNGGCATFGCPNRGDYPPASAMRAPDDCCPVCSRPLRGETVRCRVCRHAHHAECWQRNRGRCGTVGCGPSPESALSSPLPSKILLPKLRVGMFLGVDFVPMTTVVWTILMELFSIMLAPVAPPLAGLCLLMMVAGIAWAAITAERYNINIAWRAITKSKLVLGVEVLEWRAIDFDDVEALWICGHPETGVAQLTVSKRDHTGEPITPPVPYGSEDLQKLQEILRQMHAFSVMPVLAADPDGTSRRRLT